MALTWRAACIAVVLLAIGIIFRLVALLVVVVGSNLVAPRPATT